MKELQQRHKGDRERLQREMQAYYREHGINPLSAFAPLLVQIPVFISLYYLMRHDVKNGLFGDAGMLFIPHLTQKPHGAVLVALVLTYLISQITGSLIATRTMQGGQRGLMLALPLLFVGIVARFPLGWPSTGSRRACGRSASRWPSGDLERAGCRSWAARRRWRRPEGPRPHRPRRARLRPRGSREASRREAPNAQAQARPAPLAPTAAAARRDCEERCHMRAFLRPRSRRGGPSVPSKLSFATRCATIGDAGPDAPPGSGDLADIERCTTRPAAAQRSGSARRRAAARPRPGSAGRACPPSTSARRTCRRAS